MKMKYLKTTKTFECVCAYLRQSQKWLSGGAL